LKSVAILLLAFSLSDFWRETNSRASSARGAAAFSDKKYVQAADAFRRAYELDPSPRNAFNLGTAEIAAGEREKGSATLGEAMKDPALRADALFNRGNSALAAKALDNAIADFTSALKTRPQFPEAKRNLEIALKQREQQRRDSQSRAQQQNDQGRKPEQQQPTPGPGQQAKPGELDLEALLRSVQQQEQDELRRMKGKPGEARVGW
jgi:tetratricopeptide (TPR) repeat protein